MTKGSNTKQRRERTPLEEAEENVRWGRAHLENAQAYHADLTTRLHQQHYAVESARQTLALLEEELVRLRENVAAPDAPEGSS